jgi:predicted HicB family RNase H-like nuclease
MATKGSKETDVKMLHVRLPEGLHATLVKRAKQEERSLNSFIVRTLREAVSEKGAKNG